RITMLKVLALVALLASPALADKNKNKNKGDDAPAPEAPAEQAPKKNKNKDKQEAPAPPPPPTADASKNKNTDKKKDDAPPPAPPPAEAPKGDLKPGQGVGRRVCLGSTSGIGNIEVTSARTVGVATCNGELRRVFLEKGICKGKATRTKVEYGWQFADTTGKDDVSCP
ncbi:MAG TPA: hypothetical protein VIU61_22395, partial [Kofleriaceae bacterium]